MWHFFFLQRRVIYFTSLCYFGLMCSSCSCSKYRHWLPALMDCAVRDDRPVRLYSPAEYDIEDSHTFYIAASPRCFAEDDRPLHRGSSVNTEQKVWGGMIAICIAQVFVYYQLQHCGVFHIQWFCECEFWSALCLLVTLCQVFFCVFLFGWIQNIFAFVLLQPVWLQEFFIRAACVATLHSTKDYHRDLQRVSVEWVW